MADSAVKSTNLDLLLIRLDRMGDLVLTLPADQEIKPSVTRRWWVNESLEFLPRLSAETREFDSISLKFSWSGLWSTVRKLKNLKPRAVVIFYAPPWIYWAVFLAGIRYRLGRISQWFSFITLNSGVRQSRSRSEKHELEYNRELLRGCLEKAGLNNWLEPSPKRKPLELQTPETVVEGLPSKYIVVHPGMSGSALNWSLDHYEKVIRDLNMKIPVVITGSEADRAYWEPLREKIKSENVFWKTSLSIPQLLLVLKRASVVIVPSTGVIHLATSVQTPVVGLYSPVLSQHPKRWGPLGEKTKTFILTETKPDQVIHYVQDFLA